MTKSVKEDVRALANTRLWDPMEFLETPDDVIAYLEAAFEDGNPCVIAATMDDVAVAGV